MTRFLIGSTDYNETYFVKSNLTNHQFYLCTDGVVREWYGMSHEQRLLTSFDSKEYAEIVIATFKEEYYVYDGNLYVRVGEITQENENNR